MDFTTASKAELKRVWDRIAREMGDDRFMTKRELDHLPGIMTPDEQVLAFASGIVDNNSWLIALTDHRVILLDKGLLYGLRQITIDLDRIHNVDCATGLLTGEIAIGGAITYRIKSVAKAAVQPFTARLRDAIAARHRSQGGTSGGGAPTANALADLERLAALRDRGILTEDEFAAEKARLLGARSADPAVAAIELPDHELPSTAYSGDVAPRRPRKVFTKPVVAAGVVLGVLFTAWVGSLDGANNAAANLPEPQAPSGANAPGNRKPTVRLSKAARDMRALYAELEGFKDDPKFHSVAYARCCEYNGWMKRVDRLNERSGGKLVREILVSPRDLSQLGTAYANSAGQETDYTRWISARLRTAFNPSARGPTRGVVVRGGEACSDISITEKSLHALAGKEIEESAQLMKSPGCKALLVGTIVGLPAAEKAISLADSPNDPMTFSYVRTESGERLWVLTDEIDYKP